MAFSESTITNASWRSIDGDIVITWTSSSPEGTTFQVYLNRSLVWHGQARTCTLPPTASGTLATIDIGTVAVGEDLLDFSSSLPSTLGTGTRIKITWQGGTYEAIDLKAFNIYAGLTPGGSVSYTTPLATVTAYPGGIITDGFGQGGFGRGGFGRSSANWTWISVPMARGTWNVAVKPLDTAGNEGTAVTGSVTITGPPDPLPRFTDGKRLHYTYNLSGPRQVTLAWNPTT